MNIHNARTAALLGLLCVPALVAACQTAVPVEEAKTVTASFTGAAFVPPPRSISDIVAVLDQQKRDDPELTARARERADQPAPETGPPIARAQFHFRRAPAAATLGRVEQQLADLTKALDYAREAGAADLEARILFTLASVEGHAGSFTRTIGYLEEAARKASPDRRGLLVLIQSVLARRYAQRGDLARADSALRAAVAVRDEMGRRHRPERLNARDDAQIARAQGWVAGLRGQYGEAERHYREAVRIASADPELTTRRLLDVATGNVAAVLVHQGRLVEAEIEARRALRGALGKSGRYSLLTAELVTTLARIVAEQGRYAEAETLARAAVDIFDRVSASEDSRSIARARKFLAHALVGQEHWQDALAEYDWIRTHTADPRLVRRLLNDPDFALALLQGGRFKETLAICERVIRNDRRELGAADPLVVTFRGLRAATHAAMGEREQARREFAEVLPHLLARAPEADDEASTPVAQDRRLATILTSYINLLAEAHGTPSVAGQDAAAEAFRLAEVVRGRAVERALDASAARAAAETPRLADLVRREQDARKQIAALYGHLANALDASRDQRDEDVVARLRAEIDGLRATLRTITGEIKRTSPAYAQLVEPAPATLAQARAALRPGEALVSIFVTRERTFVWAVPATGPVAFATTAVGEAALGTTVKRLREALDPGAQTLGQIPAFDVGAAYELYRALLEPVRSSWESAESLLIVPHGALGQLPLALLSTRPIALGPEEGALFSRYRSVPWLVRTHAVTVLPSAGALVTLRALPERLEGRRPFIGFGDPYFSLAQAREAEGGASNPVAVASLTEPVSMRNLKVEALASARLGMLPRLPDTADEIRSIAKALGADQARDVFLGARANERAVRTLDLARYRVIAFATHGLVPGDLDGLTQPALALTAPEVANVEGDGLLTMEKILALRLDADWVVLSACNTAAGNGAGSEAVSGLGRAFFYAGARALLVSNWPVETTSARALTTDLFRRQSGDPRLGRARALQQTLQALIDGGALLDATSGRVIASYAHPIFWAPFTLVGDGGGGTR